MSSVFDVVQVGVARTPFKTILETPRNGRDVNADCTIEVDPKYADCLLGIENCKYLFVLCWFDKSDRTVSHITPHFSPNAKPKGVFAARSPVRPNPIGLCFAELIKVDGLTLHVKGLDAMDGTPVIDIKPQDNSLDAVFE